MGYDVMFVRVRGAAQKSFPLPYDAISQADLEGALPWSEFRRWLCSVGQENGEADSILVEYPDGGSINFSGSSSSIWLDTHASWPAVVDAFRKLKSLSNDACIFDPQRSEYYDEKSFLALLQTDDYK
jgi:hypothetical protein